MQFSPTSSVLHTSLASLALLACSSAGAPPKASTDAAATSVPAAPSSEAPLPPAPEERGSRGVPLENLHASGSFLTPPSLAVTSFGAAVSPDRLFVLGGYSGTPHAYSKEGQSSEVLAFDLLGNAGWTHVAELERGLQGLVATFYQDRLCHFGGNHASNEAGSATVMTSMTSARCFDTKSSDWSDLPALPVGRSSHGGTLIGSTAYLVGGWTLDGDASSGAFVEDVLALDLKNPAAGWRSIPAPFARRAVGVTSTGDKLVVVGGMSKEGKVVDEVDVYDTKTGKWSRGPAYPGDAFGLAVASTGGLVHASGRDGLLRSWKPGSPVWSTVRRLGFGRFFHEMRAVGKDLVLFGGIGGMHSRGRTRVVERVPSDASLSYGQLTFSYPGTAKNRQGILAHGEEVYLFGGNDSLEQHDFERSNFTSEGWVLDLATLALREGAAYPMRRQSMQALGTATGGFAIGGFGHEPLAGEKTQAISHAEVFGLDWDAQAWVSKGRLPRGRTQFGVVDGGAELWIFGGLDYDPNRENSFDHERSIWVAKKEGPALSFQVSDLELPGPRRAFAGAKLGNSYYLVGGMKEGFQLVEDCLEFGFETRAFSEIPCPAARLSGDLVPANGKLYLVGGSVKTEAGIEESRRIDVYDPKTKKWSKLDFELPLSARHLRALPFHEQILLLTTHNDRKEMNVGLLNPGGLVSSE